MQEIWKPVKDYEGLYEVSNLGRVQSLNYRRTKQVRCLSATYNAKGYLQVLLCNNGKKQTRTVHLIVAESFLNHTRCGMKLVVDHINDVRNDNRLENLRIITNRENTYRTQDKYASKYKGVCWYESSKKWRAKITIANKCIHLGVFNTEEEASEVYQNKLKTL